MMKNPAIVELRTQMKSCLVNQVELSKRTFIPQNRISDLLLGKRRFTLESDVKLCKVFNLKPTHFLHLQLNYELEKANNKYSTILNKIIPF